METRDTFTPLDAKLQELWSRIPEAVRGAICTCRRVDPNMGVEEIVVHVGKFHGYQTSVTVVKRVLSEAGLARRVGHPATAGLADFNDPAGGSFRMRVVEVERRTSGDIIYLGASELLREQDWKPQELTDLYFGRWPNQEANFRAVNQAVGLKEVHGYGKQLVDNVSVVTERLGRLSEEDRALAEVIDAGAQRMEKDRAKFDDCSAALARTRAALDKHCGRQTELDSRRTWRS